MIILEGPDNSGKSVLAEAIHVLTGDGYAKSIQSTTYNDYLHILTKPLHSIVFDRNFWSDLPYSHIVRKERSQFTLKEFHNLHWFTLAHNPVVVLCNEKARWDDGPVPENMFRPLLGEYGSLFRMLDLPFMYYRWTQDVGTAPAAKHLVAKHLVRLETENRVDNEWWAKMKKRGYMGIGSMHPEVLYIAEELSPNNVNRLPFEAGPSGRYLSELMDNAEIPIGKVFLTNWKKTGDNARDTKLLRRELRHLKPDRVVILGAVAKVAVPILEEKEIPWVGIEHPSSIVRFHPERKQRYLELWRNAYEGRTHGKGEKLQLGEGQI